MSQASKPEITNKTLSKIKRERKNQAEAKQTPASQAKDRGFFGVGSKAADPSTASATPSASTIAASSSSSSSQASDKEPDESLRIGVATTHAQYLLMTYQFVRENMERKGKVYTLPDLLKTIAIDYTTIMAMKFNISKDQEHPTEPLDPVAPAPGFHG